MTLYHAGVNVPNRTIFVCASLLLSSVLAACAQHVPSHALRQKGEQAVMIHDWPAAVQWYNELVSRDQTDWKAQAALGHAALEAGDLNTARRALEIALALQPGNTRIATDLADTLEQQEAWDDLFAYLRDRAVTTSHGDDWLRLARVAIEVDDPDTARSALRTAIAVDAGTDVELYLRAATLAQEIGDREDAMRALGLAWEMSPGDPDVRAAIRDMGIVPGPTMRLSTGE